MIPRQIFYISFCLILTAILAYGGGDPIKEMGVMRIKRVLQAPDFSLQGIDGKKRSLSDFRGKFVMLNFWATW